MVLTLDTRIKTISSTDGCLLLVGVNNITARRDQILDDPATNGEVTTISFLARDNGEFTVFVTFRQSNNGHVITDARFVLQVSTDKAPLLHCSPPCEE